MKKIFTLFSAAAVAAAASAQVQVLPTFDLGEKDGEPVVAGKLPAETVLIDDANLKATTVWEANCGINNAMFSEAEASLGTLTHWIEVRVDALPNEYDPYGVQLEDKTPIVFSAKADMDLTLYYRTGPGKSINMTNQNDWTVLNGSVVEVADPSSAKNSLFVYTFKLEADNDYVLSQKGGTGRFYGFAYTAEGAEVPEGPLMSWDFTKWSDATVANLKAGANWSDIEKANDTEPTDISKDNCFWQVNCEDGISPEKYLMANDEVIAELKGLVYTNVTTNRSLAIAVNYPSTSLGDYHGASYLWLGSKNVKYFMIPGVPAGATIKMGIESHKSTDARGVKLTIGDEELYAPDGNPVAVPTTYEELEWLVPATAAESNDIQITNTNGCHVYFITVTAADGTTGIETVANDENPPVEYYNLQGVRVANPESGLYIKRQGNKAMKVLVK